MELTMEKARTRARRRRIPTTRRERWAWYFYDFGNSAYAAVVLLAVYSAYFKGQVVGGSEGTRLWGVSVGIAMLVVALLSPILGTLADYTASKKKYLFIFSSMAIVFTAALFFVQPGNIFMGMLFFILAEIGYRSGQVFYNALLGDIASPNEMSRVSGNGWAIGSAGGIVCLLVVLPLIVLVGGTFVVRISFLITAAFYLASSIPIFIWLRERAEPQPLPQKTSVLALAFRRLADTFKAIRNYKELVKFIVAFLVFNNGIMMTLDFAAIIGATLFGMTQTQLIIFVIIVQITSVLGAFLFGKLAGRWSSKYSLIISLVLMIVAVSLLFIVDSLVMFNIIGALAGFALTGVQSVSRTMVGQMAPEERSTEFYGFFSVAGQLSAFIGPALYGFLAAGAAVWYENQGMAILPAEQTGMRVAVIAMVVFLAFGLVLALTVKKPELVAAEMAESAPQTPA